MSGKDMADRAKGEEMTSLMPLWIWRPRPACDCRPDISNSVGLVLEKVAIAAGSKEVGFRDEMFESRDNK